MRTLKQIKKDEKRDSYAAVHIQAMESQRDKKAVRFSDAQVQAWMDRNHYDGSLSAARLAMEDAASLLPESP